MCSTSAAFAVALELMRFQLLRENERVRSSNARFSFSDVSHTCCRNSPELLSATFFLTRQMLASHLL